MTNTLQFTTEAGHEVTIVLEPLYRSARQVYTRAYVGGTTPGYDAPRYSTIGDDPENDKAWRKYNRDEVKAMRALLAELEDELVDMFALVAAPKYSFSRRAGCSCPCSPGFVMDQRLQYMGRVVTQLSIVKAS